MTNNRSAKPSSSLFLFLSLSHSFFSFLLSLSLFLAHPVFLWLSMFSFLFFPLAVPSSFVFLEQPHFPHSTYFTIRHPPLSILSIFSVLWANHQAQPPNISLGKCSTRSRAPRMSRRTVLRNNSFTDLWTKPISPRTRLKGFRLGPPVRN